MINFHIRSFWSRKEVDKKKLQCTLVNEEIKHLAVAAAHRCSGFQARTYDLTKHENQSEVQLVQKISNDELKTKQLELASEIASDQYKTGAYY